MSRRRWFLIGLSVAAVIAAPLVVHWLAFWSYASAYAGACGPHAPDIAARPCTREAYLAEFDAGFAGVGLFLVECAAVVVTGFVAGLAWLVAYLRGVRRAARRGG